jgi:hypothetical protein
LQLDPCLLLTFQFCSSPFLFLVLPHTTMWLFPRAVTALSLLWLGDRSSPAEQKGGERDAYVNAVLYRRSPVSAAAPGPTAPLPTPLHHGLLVEIYRGHSRSASRGGLMICGTRRAAMPMPMGAHRSSCMLQFAHARLVYAHVLSSCKTCVCYNLLLLHIS